MDYYRFRSPTFARRSWASPPPYGVQGCGRGHQFYVPEIFIIRLEPDKSVPISTTAIVYKKAKKILTVS